MCFKKIFIKQQATTLVFWGVCFSMMTISRVQAQTLAAQPAPAKSSVATPTAAGVIMSCPLLLSPFSSPATKARIRQMIEDEDNVLALVRTGDASARSGNWQSARAAYQEALGLSPEQGLGHQLALRGLIGHCRVTDDMVKGLEYSRQAIYRHGNVAEGFYENNVTELMQFSLLLNKVGQSAEALSAYNRAASLLDYRDSESRKGEPYLKVMLPELALVPTSPEQVQYTSARLQALANTAIAHEDNEGKDMVYMREAVKLYPDSAVTQYYLGEALLGPRYSTESKAAFQKAIELGDEKTGAAAKERMGTLR